MPSESECSKPTSCFTSPKILPTSCPATQSPRPTPLQSKPSANTEVTRPPGAKEEAAAPIAANGLRYAAGRQARQQEGQRSPRRGQRGRVDCERSRKTASQLEKAARAAFEFGVFAGGVLRPQRFSPRRSLLASNGDLLI